jgi:hypothetical protein
MKNTARKTQPCQYLNEPAGTNNNAAQMSRPTTSRTNSFTKRLIAYKPGGPGFTGTVSPHGTQRCDDSHSPWAIERIDTLPGAAGEPPLGSAMIQLLAVAFAGGGVISSALGPYKPGTATSSKR